MLLQLFSTCNLVNVSMQSDLDKINCFIYFDVSTVVELVVEQKLTKFQQFIICRKLSCNQVVTWFILNLKLNIL